MSRTARPFAGVLLLAAATAACVPEVSDTGYVGTWSRGNRVTRSVISIVKDGEGYRVRIGLDSIDGKRVVVCDWDGHCEERFDGEVIAKLEMQSSVDPETGHLRVATHTNPVATDVRQETDFLDEFVLRKGGTVLVARTLVQEGREFDEKFRPRRIFKKVANSVTDPPH